MNPARKYWSIAASAGSNGGSGKRIIINFYGDITMYPDSFEEDKSPQEIASELQAVGDIEHITARINSPGGNAFAGLAIYNILKSHPAPVTTQVDGLAGSAASIIFAAGDTRVMPMNTLLFVHNPQSAAAGYARDLRKVADELDLVTAAIRASYKEATGLSDDKLKMLMDAESLLTAQEAYDMGFATTAGQMPVTASISRNVLTMNGLAIDLQHYGITLTAAARSAVLIPKAVRTDRRDKLNHRLGVMAAAINRSSPRER